MHRIAYWLLNTIPRYTVCLWFGHCFHGDVCMDCGYTWKRGN